jgi:hypothetical protein
MRLNGVAALLELGDDPVGDSREHVRRDCDSHMRKIPTAAVRAESVKMAHVYTARGRMR